MRFQERLDKALDTITELDTYAEARQCIEKFIKNEIIKTEHAAGRFIKKSLISEFESLKTTLISQADEHISVAHKEIDKVIRRLKRGEEK